MPVITLTLEINDEDLQAYKDWMDDRIPVMENEGGPLQPPKIKANPTNAERRDRLEEYIIYHIDSQIQKSELRKTVRKSRVRKGI
jgi:hypothetical protein